MRTRTLLTALTGFAAASALVLSGCSALAPASSEAPASEPGDDGVKSFLACLTAADINARITTSGQIGVEIPTEPMGDEQTITTSDGQLGVESDGSGVTWVIPIDATYFTEDPDTQDAYAACEDTFPDFEQPVFDPTDDPEFRKAAVEEEKAALAFAKCARENGFSQIEDPNFAESNGLMLPDGITEDDFRGLLEECLDPEATPFNFGQFADAPFEAWQVVSEFQGAPGS